MAGKSEPSKRVLNNIGHAFKWEVITNAPGSFRKRKILEAFYIVKQKPRINDQLDIQLEIALLNYSYDLLLLIMFLIISVLFIRFSFW